MLKISRYLMLGLSLLALFTVNGGIGYYYRYFCCSIDSSASKNCCAEIEKTCTASCCSGKSDIPAEINGESGEKTNTCPVKDYYSYIYEALDDIDSSTSQKIQITTPFLSIRMTGAILLFDPQHGDEDHVFLDKPPPRPFTGTKFLYFAHQIRIPDGMA